MAIHGRNGTRVGPGQLYLAWLAAILVILFAFQFLAHEHRWAKQQPPAKESFQVFHAMLDEYLSSPRNNHVPGSYHHRGYHPDVRQMLENVCKAESQVEISQPQVSMKEYLARFLAARPEIQRSGSAAPSGYLIENRESAGDRVSGVENKRIAALEKEIAGLHEVLRRATTLMPLRDAEVENDQMFMSSLNPADHSGLPGEFEFPSKHSLGRVLCLMGSHPWDGTQNKYGFAWKEHLPSNATLVPGVTLIADNLYHYENIWHGMSALAPFASWRARNKCLLADRVLLYYKGEVVDRMSPWVEHLLRAVFGREVPVQTMEEHARSQEKGEENAVVCFEHAIVNRKGLSNVPLKLKELFEIVKCRTWAYCGVGSAPSNLEGDSSGGKRKSGPSSVHVTLYLREGARAFKNSSAVQRVVQRACQEHRDCDLEVAHAGNLTFCEQVTLMSRTDVLITTHGAQLTNLMFMPKGSSVMEHQGFGWLELAGIGQFIYTWLANWTEVDHEGIWRETSGPPCPFPSEDTLACFLFYKDFQISHNETNLADWTSSVLKKFEKVMPPSKVESNGSCACDDRDRERGLASWLK